MCILSGKKDGTKANLWFPMILSRRSSSDTQLLASVASSRTKGLFSATCHSVSRQLVTGFSKSSLRFEMSFTTLSFSCWLNPELILSLELFLTTILVSLFAAAVMIWAAILSLGSAFSAAAALRSFSLTATSLSFLAAFIVSSSGFWLAGISFLQPYHPFHEDFAQFLWKLLYWKWV